MNPNPAAKTILCYGDSNTWGQKPDKTGRFTADQRWTGLLQRALGDGAYIIEEGLSSRTTDLEFAKKPGRNGKTYLVPCLATHNPLDVVVLMLGTNDLKCEFNRSAEEIATAVAGLLDIIADSAKTAAGEPTQVVVVSPILVDDIASRFQEWYSGWYDAASAAKSRQLAVLLQDLAQERECLFVNAAEVASAGEDGIHMTLESHAGLAALLHRVLSQSVA